MVVSGLPNPCAQHAGNVACFAIEILSATRKFKTLDEMIDSVKLRIGIHTGSVVAGVLGVTMPRYCLIGNTVNVASQLEASGESNKILISSVCKEELEKVGGYQTIRRGVIELKG